nr:hypothetical protein [Patescibacteria group bacterium]
MRFTTSRWFRVVTIVYAFVVTVFCFVRNPLPFPDRGHRCFAVVNEQAAKVVVTILGSMGGLEERFTFSPGPTTQTLLSDNETVIIQHTAAMRESGLPLNAISIVVSNPLESATAAVAMLQAAGFTARVESNVLGPEVSEKFVFVTSDAFDGWGLAFRRHVLMM